jgi:hypothetical protein
MFKQIFAEKDLKMETLRKNWITRGGNNEQTSQTHKSLTILMTEQKKLSALEAQVIRQIYLYNSIIL